MREVCKLMWSAYTSYLKINRLQLWNTKFKQLPHSFQISTITPVWHFDASTATTCWLHVQSKLTAVGLHICIFKRHLKPINLIHRETFSSRRRCFFKINYGIIPIAGLVANMFLSTRGLNSYWESQTGAWWNMETELRVVQCNTDMDTMTRIDFVP